ncbi:hypothetical protein B0T19DRAFT_488852 [Cercophora scortea]|uniref:Uncharacterized protein n=1 Tax=Cercophora scortea TaxID=314031 RepID=A0AAE0I335_9PEZI|nr:hypothetical protein B0T19DRAFT_488852 [Cercophora scortea]
MTRSNVLGTASNHESPLWICCVCEDPNNGRRATGDYHRNWSSCLPHDSLAPTTNSEEVLNGFPIDPPLQLSNGMAQPELGVASSQSGNTMRSRIGVTSTSKPWQGNAPPYTSSSQCNAGTHAILPGDRTVERPHLSPDERSEYTPTSRPESAPRLPDLGDGPLDITKADEANTCDDSDALRDFIVQEVMINAAPRILEILQRELAKFAESLKTCEPNSTDDDHEDE